MFLFKFNPQIKNKYKLDNVELMINHQHQGWVRECRGKSHTKYGIFLCEQGQFCKTKLAVNESIGGVDDSTNYNLIITH